jgi:hypothetical protein
MNQDHFAPAGDRLLVAQLTGTARHHARWRDLTGDEQAAAVRELHDLAAGRADLLAQVAGIFEARPRAGTMSRSPARPPPCAGSPEPTTPSSRSGPPKDGAGPRPHASRRTAAGPPDRTRRISTAARHELGPAGERTLHGHAHARPGPPARRARRDGHRHLPERPGPASRHRGPARGAARPRPATARTAHPCAPAAGRPATPCRKVSPDPVTLVLHQVSPGCPHLALRGREPT